MIAISSEVVTTSRTAATFGCRISMAEKPAAPSADTDFMGSEKGRRIRRTVTTRPVSGPAEILPTQRSPNDPAERLAYEIVSHQPG